MTHYSREIYVIETERQNYDIIRNVIYVGDIKTEAEKKARLEADYGENRVVYLTTWKNGSKVGNEEGESFFDRMDDQYAILEINSLPKYFCPRSTKFSEILQEIREDLRLSKDYRTYKKIIVIREEMLNIFKDYEMDVEVVYVPTEVYLKNYKDFGQHHLIANEWEITELLEPPSES